VTDTIRVTLKWTKFHLKDFSYSLFLVLCTSTEAIGESFLYVTKMYTCRRVINCKMDFHLYPLCKLSLAFTSCKAISVSLSFKSCMLVTQSFINKDTLIIQCLCNSS
jgi:hypothetical protein